ncbi:MAG: hypothetical protein AAGK21_08530 [Bacteroidota bacterium]
MRRLIPFAVLAPVILLAACGTEDASETEATGEITTAEALADAVLDRYEANVGQVDSFTVVAGDVQAQYALADSAGVDRFDPPEVTPTGDGQVSPERAQLLANQVPNGRRLARGLRTADFEGQITHDGREVYLLTSEDPGVLIGEPGNAAPGQEVETRVYIDAETFDVVEIYRGLAVADSASTDSVATEVVGRIIYSDFQTTDGLTLPFTIREVTTGLVGAMDEDARMIRGGQLGLQLRQLQAQPQSAERDAQIAGVESELRLLNEGILENEIRVESVRIDGSE